MDLLNAEFKKGDLVSSIEYEIENGVVTEVVDSTTLPDQPQPEAAGPIFRVKDLSNGQETLIWPELIEMICPCCPKCGSVANMINHGGNKWVCHSTHRL